ncbi:MAG: hypothetical protein C0432_03695 [Candidatus Puniceispirillum sp.]|nr:hypothetical protein [Candidatus Pelagibacter sp.]MBA4283378.1 hypothetical protein [Candidatus Puniceispirillum sp.]
MPIDYINSSSSSLFSSTRQTDLKNEKSMVREQQKQSQILSKSSGSDSYADTIDSGEYIHTEMNIDTFQILKRGSDVLKNRFAFMQQQTSQAKEVATKLKSAIMQYSSFDGAANLRVFSNDVNGCLSELTRILNVGDGRFSTFSGPALDKKSVVDLTTLPLIDKNAPVSTDYFQGNAASLNVNIHSYEINVYPANGADPFFSKIIHACRLAQVFSSGETITDKREILDKCQNLVDSALNFEYLSITQKIGDEITKANELGDILIDAELTEQSKLETINNQDKLMAMVRYQELESSRVILQNLIMQTARMDREFADTISRV